MHYIIDGHNLIPKLGLRLNSMDDELELVSILQEFARLKRHKVEVYFDGAPPAQAGTRNIGTIRAHFIRLGQTADNAIRNRLNKMGKSAKNVTVISSDREVQGSAKVNQTHFVSSQEFVKQIRAAFNSAPKSITEDNKLSAQEVDEWMELFRSRKS